MTSVQRMALSLAGLAVVASAAALYGPSEAWAGIDVGAVGASLFVMTLVAGVWLFAKRGDQVFPDHMSVAERRAWVGLLFVSVILASYLRQLWALSGEAVIPQYIDGLFAHHFVQRLFVLILAWSLISYLVGRGAGGVEADERDLRLRHRADRAGDWALTLIVIAGICVLASVPPARLAWWLAPVVLANLLIGLLIAKALVEQVALAVIYRRA